MAVGPTKLRQQKADSPRTGFPINLRCSECGEKAKYAFEVEVSRKEYLALWRDWHAEPEPCAACPFLSKAKRKKCTVCGGTGTVWPYRHDGHKRSLIPLPNFKKKIKHDPERMPLLCEPPKLEYAPRR